MSEYEFKVGDRVEVVAGVDSGALMGKTGVVEGVRNSSLWPICVNIDGSDAIYPDGVKFSADELKLLGTDATPAEPDVVSHPPHYTAHPSGVECIQVTEHMGFNLGNAVKYIWRCDLKQDAVEDLKKARWYIDREIAKRVSA